MKVKEDFNLKEFLIPYIATTIGSFIAAAGVKLLQFVVFS